jgi:hypothetical protein
MPVTNLPPQYFGNMSSADLRLRFVDLSARFPTGDAPAGTPTAVVQPIDGDDNPMMVNGSASWDTGPRNVFVGQFGQPYLSLGPRILFTLSGGTKGNTYTIVVSWQDSSGQLVSIPVYQFVQWGPSG